MRVAQVVTLISPDAAYGGPVRVALNQAKELMSRGHDVTIFAGCRGYSPVPNEIEGVRVRLFPALNVVPASGFAGLFSVRLLRALSKAIESIDVLHVHVARDLITLPAAMLARRKQVPFVLQCHGMIDPSDRFLAGPLDALLTRRVLRSASRVFYLTDRERRGLELVNQAPLQLFELPNGVPAARKASAEDRLVPEVLFLARLQRRKRPAEFVEAAEAILKDRRDIMFSLVGPDEGEAARLGLVAAGGIAGCGIRWEGPLASSETIDRMRRAEVYVLPSVDEPFPMSVLEAMSVGVPVIITESCGLAPAVRNADAGLVVDHSLEALIGAMRTLISDAALRHRLGENAYKMSRAHFSMAAVVDLLEQEYLLARVRTAAS